MHPQSTILELGAGVSGILALTLAPRIAHYTATDQSYVLKLLQRNVTENLSTVFPTAKKAKSAKGGSSGHGAGRVEVRRLDWQLDAPSTFSPVDMLLACDCIYNEALIEPFNNTCAEICALRQSETSANPTLCVIAQQLRSPEVFEAWLKGFMERFIVWQVPGSVLGRELGEGSGFVVHVGVLKQN